MGMDRVLMPELEKPGVRVLAIRGVAEDLPLEAEKNTAGRALIAMIDALKLDYGLDMHIDKGIPLSSGLGGSAASAVAASGPTARVQKLPVRPRPRSGRAKTS
jgi:homoserine kinase